MQLRTGHLEVNERHQQITLSFALPTHPDKAMADLISAFGEVPAPYGYDWLLDLRNVTPAVTLFHLQHVARKWEDIAKGRDIGRRTAILYGFRVAASTTSHMRKLFPFRTVRPFEMIGDATSWLQAVGSDHDTEALLV